MEALKLSQNEYLLYVVLTNYLTIFSGVLFLLAFVILGLVALRVARVFGVRTDWPLMYVGPVGAIVYSVYTIVHGSGGGTQGAFTIERLIAYGAFLGCGILCWWGVRRFWKSLGALIAEGRKVKGRYA